MVDNYFPCRSQKPVFSRANGKELWVLILEKVWAKIHGSYQTIIGGQSYEVFRDLLGAPSFYHKTNEDNIKEIIENAYNNNFIISATSYPTKKEEDKLDRVGILNLQSYSLLRIATVPDQNGMMCNIVQLRNPWGNFEWSGDWSDDSPCWTDEAKRMVNLQINEFDGLFWMSFQDFVSNFVSIHLCKFVDTYNFSSFKKV